MVIVPSPSGDDSTKLVPNTSAPFPTPATRSPPCHPQSAARSAKNPHWKCHNTLGNVRNRDIHEGVVTVPLCVEEVTGQVSSLRTHLTQVLAASLAAGTAIGDSVDAGQHIPPGSTQIIVGGTGGNGGNGVGRGTGGIGGVGQGPSFQIDEFSGIQIILPCLAVGGEVTPGIGRIREGLANIREGVAEASGHFQSSVKEWLRRLRTQLLAAFSPVPRGVHDPVFYVMDPVGKYITFSLQHCHDYWTLDDLLKVYMRHRPQAGGLCVERGDYSIVSEDGVFIMPMEFTQRVRVGMLLEISILQRQIQNKTDTVENSMCPSCGCSQGTTTGNGWFKCTACERNYRTDGQDQDSEEILSPQLAESNGEAERKLFRRVHICIYRKQEKQIERIKRERDYTPLPDGEDLNLLIKPRLSSPRVSSMPPPLKGPRWIPAGHEESKKQKRKRKREEESDHEQDAQRPRKATPPAMHTHPRKTRKAHHIDL
ncbi:hypothetical protein B0H13DRAFT_2072313 [Mycena leptocephala]|nr:hypothetical protein B0H13DRAFT_2072313 [Mycena leptocephala]